MTVTVPGLAHFSASVAPLAPPSVPPRVPPLAPLLVLLLLPRVAPVPAGYAPRACQAPSVDRRRVCLEEGGEGGGFPPSGILAEAFRKGPREAALGNSGPPAEAEEAKSTVLSY